MFGKEIGRKFYEDGSVRHYPGNTVVADVTPDNSAYDVMKKLHDMLIDEGFDSSLILLPVNSYHMTVIRGLNDQVRTDEFWPEKLPKSAKMEEVDDYITAAVSSVEMPRNLRMRFDKIRLSATAMLVTLLPSDDQENKRLRDYRDKVATAIGLFLPKHKEYRFHITLAYTRVISEGEDAQRMEEMIGRMNDILASQPEFIIPSPYMAYYDDMLAFHPNRIPR